MNKSINSEFGKVPFILKKKIEKWNVRKEKDKFKVLAIDDKDGYSGLYSLSFGIDTTIYETNEKYLYGGRVELPIRRSLQNDICFIEQYINCAEDKIIKIEKSKLAHLHNKNFYKEDIKEKYSLVTACRSLNLDSNKDISMSDKIDKLKNVVEENGCIYIEYYIAMDDNNYSKYPINQYMRLNQIEEYFDEEDWYIYHNTKEVINDPITPLNRENKEVILGIFSAKKRPVKTAKLLKVRKNNKIARISKQRVYEINKNDNKKNKVIKNRKKNNYNYTINGVIR